jgi:two-component system response regulator VicR
MTILICQEEEVMLTALEFRLNKQGFEVGTATNKKDALDFIESRNPSLVVADILSDKVLGLDLLQHVLDMGKNRPPFILVSELQDDELILEALRGGAADFIAKPFNPIELVIRIRRVLGM